MRTPKQVFYFCRTTQPSDTEAEQIGFGVTPDQAYDSLVDLLGLVFDQNEKECPTPENCEFYVATVVQVKVTTVRKIEIIK